MASGIKDKVAIVGMGCTPFGEHWDKGPEDLMVMAFEEALADAGVERSRIEAAWMGNALVDINVGNSALPLAHGRVLVAAVAHSQQPRGCFVPGQRGDGELAGQLLAAPLPQQRQLGAGGLPAGGEGGC